MHCPYQARPGPISCTPVQTPALRADQRFAAPPTSCVPGETKSGHGVLQIAADSRRIMVPKVWGSLHNAAAELQCSCSTAATFCLSLSKIVSFFPLTFSLSLSQTCLLLPAVFSQSYINLQYISLIHPRSLWLSFLHLSLLQCLRSAQREEQGEHRQKVGKNWRDPQ